MKKVLSVLLPCFVCVCLIQPINAIKIEPREPIGDPVPTQQYRFVNKKFVKSVYGAYKTVVSLNSPAGGATDISNSVSYSVTNQASYNINFSSSITNSSIVGGISSSLGISIGKSISKTASATLHLKKGETGRIQARAKYNCYQGTIQRKYITDTGGTIWLNYKTGYVKQYSGQMDFKTIID